MSKNISQAYRSMTKESQISNEYKNQEFRRKNQSVC